MKLAFFKAKHGNIFSKLIGFWTKGPYSHVELVFSDGISFSSSELDGGVRFKKINYSHPERWAFVDIPVSTKEEAEILRLAKTLVGKKYDWLAILLNEFIKAGIQNSNKWYCSEVVGFLIGIRDYAVSPNKLFKVVKFIKDGGDRWN